MGPATVRRHRWLQNRCALGLVKASTEKSAEEGQKGPYMLSIYFEVAELVFSLRYPSFVVLGRILGVQNWLACNPNGFVAHLNEPPTDSPQPQPHWNEMIWCSRVVLRPNPWDIVEYPQFTPQCGWG